MPEITAQNPLGANQRSTYNFLTWQDADANLLEDMFPTQYFSVRANAAVTRFDLVSFVASTATVPTSVKQSLVADTVNIVVGIAMDAATAAGQVIRVATQGFTFCRLEATQTTALGTYLLKGATTAGRLQTGVPAAADVLDSYIAKALGVKFTIATIDMCAVVMIPRM